MAFKSTGKPRLLLLGWCVVVTLVAQAQRTYAPASVLAAGNWYQLSVTEAGVYKIDLPFLNTLGITGTIPAAQVRLFGNGGGMLPEANSSFPADDLQENAILVVDGGDGQLSGNDYILFYAPGPHHWQQDSANRRFIHRKNLYSEKAYYYLTIGGSGKRLPTQTLVPQATATVNSFDERYFYELDSVNFLSSGKEWYGEEFASAPGKLLNRSFAVPVTDVAAGQPATLITQVAARSANTASRFQVSVGGQPVQQLVVPATGTGQYDLFVQQQQGLSSFAAPAVFNINMAYTPGSFNSQGWLNWFALFFRRNLVLPPAKQLLFRDWNSVGNTAATFVLANADAATQVWEVTDALNPVRMAASVSSNQLRFSNDASRLREYVCFGNQLLSPTPEGRVANQNLHSRSEKDYFIVTHPQFLPQAQRLAQYHQQQGLRVLVVTTQQIYHEFASGSPDPTAIRDFLKMYFDTYQSGWRQRGRYLLLLGKASFDYKNRIKNNTQLVPGYQSANSVDPLATYTSDDFFAFLEDGEDINSNAMVPTLDLGVGRVPAKNIAEAKDFVDKVLAYHTASSFGPWRTNTNFVADDEDQNLHLQDAETITATTAATAPLFSINKIYLDAFRQESGSAGGRYPQANSLINSNIYNGTLIWNYSGHGGPQRLAEEVVLDQQIVNNWNNANRLPLFITATCDFAPFDQPLANSLGENLLVRPQTGAIALMTTTRVVFAFSNRLLNDNYLRIALKPDAAGGYKTLGQAMQEAKNFTYQTSGDVNNTRKFALLGDPALTLGFPSFEVTATHVNGKDITTLADSIRAMDKVVVEGVVRSNSGALLSDFGGTVFLSLFDKPGTVTTLANDTGSQPVSFSEQNSILFRGKASVRNGRFSIAFKLPKDINYQYGKGKISLYAHNETREGAGFSNNLVIGGISNTASADAAGPDIKAYLNDERFVNGSITNSNPVLLVKLSDSSGINISGAGIGNDIVATLDGDNNRYFVLNNFYESELDDFQKGSIRFQLPVLKPGPHSLAIKAWDAVNNSSEYLLHFTVSESNELRIDHVLNYPNPFSTRTAFWFEHNQPGRDLYARVEIFTVSGRLINTLAKTINTSGNRSIDIQWDGLDQYGSKIGRGVYLYRLHVKTQDGKSAEQWQRLVIL